ncbi:MAG: adenylate/guanylate cyclase domain-containing protein [Gaiellaceae bacterium]
MKPELPHGTVTFLFTDIEGSTALLKSLGGERYHDVLLEHQRLLRASVESAGGREIDTQGDSFFFAFQKAQDAVAAALAGQRALAAHPWPDNLQLRVRMGLDTAEQTVGTDRYVGLGVNRTARIMAAGHGGQVLLSGATRELVADDLPPDVSLHDFGEQRLKDLDRPVRVFQLRVPDLPTRFSRLRTLDSSAGSRLRRPRVVVPAVAVILAALAATALVLEGHSGSGLIVSPNSVGVIDPKTNEVVKAIGVGTRPGNIAADGGSVWVGNLDDKSVSQIDARIRNLVKSIPLSATPTGIAVGDRAVWVAEGAAGSLARIDPQLDVVTKTIGGLAGSIRVSGGSAGSVAVGGGSVWAAYGSSDVARVDPRTNARTATGFAGVAPAAIAYGEGAVWVANSTASTVSRISTVTTRKIFDVSVGRDPSGVAVGGGAVWVSDSGDNAVSRVDPRSNSSTTIPVGAGPAGIAYGASGVWVANAKAGTVTRIDPATSKVIATIRVGGRPTAITVGDGLVWVTVEAP